MEVLTPPQPAPESYTILRIKRRRDEEPLDALVVESRIRRKKSKGGVGVFQYAQTVEDDAWNDEKRQKDIQDEISRLARESTEKEVLKEGTAQVAEPQSPLLARQEGGMPVAGRRYTIIEVDQSISSPQKLPTRPPTVISAKDLEKQPPAPDFKMYDAVPSIPPKAPEPDPEMDKFQTMLSDYLKLHDHDIPGQPASSIEPQEIGQVQPVTGSVVKLPGAEAGDYVWDVFYHRPLTLSTWNDVANIGTLSGLPPSISDGNDSDSDSEIEDEADEDSNAEEYYKNDYPDEEDPESDSDEWHEESDFDDTMGYHDEEEQFNF